VRAISPVPATLLLLLAVGIAPPARATEVGPSAPVIEGIRIGTAGGHLRLEVVASEPLTYLLVDTAEPFTLTLFLSHATFAFPPWSREFPEGPLRRVAAVVLGRPEGLLARVELEFDRPVGHHVRQAGRWLVLSAGVPGPPSPVVVGTVETAEPEAAPPVEARPPLPPASPPGAAPERVATAPERTVPAAVPPAAAPPDRAASAPPAPPAPAPPAGRVASTTPSTRPVRIRRITPAEGSDELRVTIEADGPLTPRAFTMADPPRLVVDFESAATDLGPVSIATGGGLVARVRSAQFRASPTPVVRVVLDLLRPVPFRVEPHAGGATIRVGPGAGR
jgi:hypothetical protein